MLSCTLWLCLNLSYCISVVLIWWKNYFAHVRMTFFTSESSCSGFWLQLDSWSVILNGSVEVTYPEGRTEILCMGNSFGVSPTMEKEYMKGVMKTKVDDCQVGSYWWTLITVWFSSTPCCKRSWWSTNIQLSSCLKWIKVYTDKKGETLKYFYFILKETCS